MANLHVAAAEKSVNYCDESFVQNRSDISRIQLPVPSQFGEELDTSNFYSTQTVFEQEGPEKSFQGLNETVGETETIQNTEGNILEMRGMTTENNIEEMIIGPPRLRGIGMVDDWNQLKTRVRRFTNVERRVGGGDKQSYDQLRKLKARLKNRHKSEINLGIHHQEN